MHYFVSMKLYQIKSGINHIKQNIHNADKKTRELTENMALYTATIALFATLGHIHLNKGESINPNDFFVIMMLSVSSAFWTLVVQKFMDGFKKWNILYEYLVNIRNEERTKYDNIKTKISKFYDYQKTYTHKERIITSKDSKVELDCEFTQKMIDDYLDNKLYSDAKEVEKFEKYIFWEDCVKKIAKLEEELQKSWNKLKKIEKFLNDKKLLKHQRHDK